MEFVWMWILYMDVDFAYVRRLRTVGNEEVYEDVCWNHNQ